MLVIGLVLVAAFVFAQTCQKDQVRVSKEQAIEIARDQVSFEPEQTQIRLLRQGLGSNPFWIVSVSIPGEREDTFRRLAVVRVDANSGKVEDVERGRPVQRGD
ncbi:MAG TPA: PepSY domain-containing protein [Thermoleophilaceae bacterium]|nr:PepSY domain-containing protein [Thermoleophilaceae bacterium]